MNGAASFEKRSSEADEAQPGSRYLTKEFDSSPEFVWRIGEDGNVGGKRRLPVMMGEISPLFFCLGTYTSFSSIGSFPFPLPFSQKKEPPVKLHVLQQVTETARTGERKGRL